MTHTHPLGPMRSAHDAARQRRPAMSERLHRDWGSATTSCPSGDGWSAFPPGATGPGERHGPPSGRRYLREGRLEIGDPRATWRVGFPRLLPR